MDYQPPIAEIRHVLSSICDLKGLEATGAFDDLSDDLVAAILEEAGKFACGVFAPLNPIGDRQGCRLENGVVRTPDGFIAAYRQLVEGGWNCLSATPDHGGQGLPFLLQTAVQEMLTAANMAFSLCPMLTQGTIEALNVHGSEALKAKYLGKLISGEWTGTMNLTEPQAGSDVGALKTRAVRHDDGSYRIKGTKIFITWGEHDCADNIIHMVLARLPGAPAGTRGISLFLVPKFLVDDQGLGARNDLACVSIEHKMGIHASPTAVMAYGENDQCVGYLVGEENKGMRAMFTMMNNARIGVGLQGVAVAERAYQAAVGYAANRVQSAKFGVGGEAVRIIEHADVRRMLMTMKAYVEAARAIVYRTAAAQDRAHHGDDRAKGQGLADLLTPVAKGFGTDIANEVASLGLQVHGGMGYIEETGVAQYMRDARIAAIYEGTNGIQALDLVGRKLSQDDGRHWRELFQEIGDFAKGLDGDLAGLGGELSAALDTLARATRWLIAASPDDAAAGATPYLRMFGLSLGGYLLGREAQAGEGASDDFRTAKSATARFFGEQLLPNVQALLGPVTRGAGLLYALREDQFGR